jgi:hypothetical protein
MANHRKGIKAMQRMTDPFAYVSTLICVIFLGNSALAQDDSGQSNPAPESSSDISKQLANPLASLISVPIQFNYNEYKGKSDRSSTDILVQPVIPFRLNDRWNLISRTIIPFVDHDDFRLRDRSRRDDDLSGMGDILQSFFFSPSRVPESGWILGAGPVVLAPTATEDALGGNTWAAGPTVVALKQKGSWTYGALGNHLWSFADDDDDAANISATYFEPWVSYVTKTNTTLSLSTEATYDWNNDQLSAPLVATATQLFTVGKQIMSAGGAVKYWLESPDYGPEGFGFQLQMTFLFPK